MQKAEKRICVILKKIKTSKITHENICSAGILKDIWKSNKSMDGGSGKIRLSLACLLLFAAVYASWYQNSEVSININTSTKTPIK